MLVVSNLSEAEALHQQWRGQRIALVPTMGALHEGHIALIRRARSLGDRVVVSIFVNPLQFGPAEDLNRYPRPLEQDLATCRAENVDAVFTPTVETMYPDGLENVTTIVPPASLTNRLCGAFRPGHFTGVATVVFKLFHIIKPHVAVFGEKDAQQLAVIRKMVKDLQLPVEIIAHPTVRDKAGLALSSRNRYLQNPEERAAALSLSRILMRLRETARSAPAPLSAQASLQEVTREILAGLNGAGDLLRIEYLEAVDQITFEPVEVLKPESKVLIAAYVNQVRLIDNINLTD